MTAQFSSLPGLFEPGLWRQAGWFAVIYLTPRDASPTLGLVFRNWDVAAAIFTGWQHALGPTDTEDVVRVTIIERSRTAPHGGPDYHVHLSLDPGVVVETRRFVTEKDQAATVPGRYDAWLSVRGPTPLARFKDAYQTREAIPLGSRSDRSRQPHRADVAPVDRQATSGAAAGRRHRCGERSGLRARVEVKDRRGRAPESTLSRVVSSDSRSVSESPYVRNSEDRHVPDSIYRLVFIQLLQRYRQQRGQAALNPEKLARLDDRALFDLVQASRTRVPQGTWSRHSRRRRA